MCKLFHCYIILCDYSSVICYGCCRCTLPQGHWWACMMTKDRQPAAWWQHQLWCWHQFDPTLSARFIWTCWRMAGSRTLYPAKLVSFSSGISVNRNACMNWKFKFSYGTCKKMSCARNFQTSSLDCTWKIFCRLDALPVTEPAVSAALKEDDE